jgi:hypothetical protein
MTHPWLQSSFIKANDCRKGQQPVTLKIISVQVVLMLMSMMLRFFRAASQQYQPNAPKMFVATLTVTNLTCVEAFATSC